MKEKYIKEMGMQKEMMILGEGPECIVSTDTELTQLNNNVLVCAPSGAGKTMSYCEMKLIQTQDTNLIVTLSKRILAEKYIWLFRKRGYEVYDMNFIDPQSANIGYDPLDQVKNYSDAVSLSEAIVMANPNKKGNQKADPYWDSAAIQLLAALMTLVLKTETKPCMDTVINLLGNLSLSGDEDVTTSLDERFQRLKKREPDSEAYISWMTFRSCPRRTAGCIYSTLTSALTALFIPEVRALTKRLRKIDVRRIAENKAVLFISTSAVNPVLHSYINLFYSQMIRQLFEYAEHCKGGSLPIPVHFLMDDFACGCKVNNFADYISIFREKKISVSLLIQCESQLTAMYGDHDAVTIINNCDRYIYMGGNDLATARNMSQRLNLPLEDILYMPIGQEYVIQRGQKPIKTTRYKIKNNFTYQEVERNYQQQSEQNNKEFSLVKFFA